MSARARASTYTHLLPTSDDRTPRRAIDDAFRDDLEPDGGLETA